MATERIYLTGTAMWAKLFERNRDRGEFHTETDGITSLDLVMEKEELDKLKDAGSRLRPKVTDEGLSIKFKRPWVHRSIDEFGGAPQVVDKDDHDWDDSVSIGNGSTVRVAVDIYDTQMGKGTRLVGVKVLNLIEFEGDGEPREPRLPF